MDSVDLAYDLTKEILEECPDLGGIVCCNMSNPVGAARAVTETKSKAVIVGMDHDEEALHDLDEADLIERERYAGRGGRRIYLKVVLAEPGEETDENPAPTIPEIRTSHERKSGPGAIGKPAPRNNMEKPESRNHTEKAKGYGRYGNVFLSEGQLQSLQEEYPEELARYIEEMSVYLKASGKGYHDYEAGLQKWAANDRSKNAASQPERDYSYNGEDSL
jgi:hypothetical protein